MAHPNEDLVREGFAFGRGDVDALRKFFGDDVLLARCWP